MTREDLLDAIGEVDAELVTRAEGRPRRRFPRWVGAVAALLILAIGVGVFLGNGLFGTAAYAIERAQYPAMATYPKNPEADLGKWMESRRLQRAYFGAGEGLDGFFTRMTAELLSGSGNRLYSPLNIYMALAMLAEVTAGESREEILSLLGVDTLEALRTQAHAIWNANYCDDGIETSILASSLWLSEEYEYRADTLRTLAASYYASSFRGEMGSGGYDRALQGWLNEQTGGLFGGKLSHLTMPSDTVMALATTLYFTAKWSEEFDRSLTKSGTFHAPNGDMTCDFMHERASGSYYWGEHFSAVNKYLDQSGNMWFILPDEGFGVNDLLADSEALSFLASPTSWEQREGVMVNLSLPRFDVTSQTEIGESLRRLGVTACFTPEADFSPLLPSGIGASLSRIEHGARLVLDEKGIKAAAYTVALCGSATPPREEVDFTLDRPFLFVLTSRDGLPLFIGAVEAP